MRTIKTYSQGAPFYNAFMGELRARYVSRLLGRYSNKKKMRSWQDLLEGK